MQKINKRMHFPFRISYTRDAYHLKYLGLDSCSSSLNITKSTWPQRSL